jgi:hypothetical protein
VKLVANNPKDLSGILLLLLTRLLAVAGRPLVLHQLAEVSKINSPVVCGTKNKTINCLGLAIRLPDQNNLHLNDIK